MCDETTNVLSSHSAAASAAGFCYQFHRAIEALCLGHNGLSVGIETLDDVVVAQRDGRYVLEQDKISTSSDTEVYGDGSRNLLNTLSIWLAAALNHEVDVENTRFLLVSNRQCSSKLVQEISNATDDKKADEVLKALIDLDRSSRAYAKLTAMLGERNAREAFKQICIATTLVVDDVDNGEAASSLPVPSAYESSREGIYQGVLGWMQQNALKNWLEKGPYIVTYQQLLDYINACQSRLLRHKERERPERAIKIANEDIRRATENLFVKQIRLVSDDSDLVDEAVMDYLRCMTEKFRLSETGEIPDDDWLDHDCELKKRWKDIFRRNVRKKNDPATEIGCRIMEETLDASFHGDLAGAPVVYSYIPRGSYHRLSDQKEVGWHPEFEQLLGGANGRSI